MNIEMEFQQNSLNNYLIKLDSPSGGEEDPEDHQSVSDSVYDSIHEQETDYCKDSSDFTDNSNEDDDDDDDARSDITEGIATIDVLEYEVDTALSSNEYLFSNEDDSSSGTDRFDIQAAALASYFKPNELKSTDRGNVYYTSTLLDTTTSNTSDLSSDNESDSDSGTEYHRRTPKEGFFDREMGKADYWKCIKCKNPQNNPMYRYCERCYKIRKDHFPPRPSVRKPRAKRFKITSTKECKLDYQQINAMSSKIATQITSKTTVTAPATATMTAPAAVTLTGSATVTIVGSATTTLSGGTVFTSSGIASTSGITTTSITTALPNQSTSTIHSANSNSASRKRLISHSDDDALISDNSDNNAMLPKKKRNNNNNNIEITCTNSVKALKNYSGIKTSVSEYIGGAGKIPKNAIRVNYSSTITSGGGGVGISTIANNGDNTSIISDFCQNTYSKINDLNTFSQETYCSEIEQLNRKEDLFSSSVAANKSDDKLLMMGGGNGYSNTLKLCDPGFSVDSGFESIVSSCSSQVSNYEPYLDVIDDKAQSDSSIRPAILDNKIKLYRKKRENYKPYNFINKKQVQPNEIHKEVIKSVGDEFFEIANDTETRLSKAIRFKEHLQYNCDKVDESITKNSITSPIPIVKEIGKIEDSNNYNNNNNNNRNNNNNTININNHNRVDYHCNDNYENSLSNPCVVCLTNSKDGVFVHGHLLHLCCCYTCAKRIWKEQKRCPICNLKINTIMRLYVH